MRPFDLVFMLLLGAAPTADGAERARELWLAGGSLRLCSELDPASCREAPPSRDDARTAAHYALDAQSIARATDPVLWGRPGAPSVAEIEALLRYAMRVRGEGAQTRAQLEALFESHCVEEGARVRPCTKAVEGAADPWRALLDDERSGVLSALEIPQFVHGRRRIEQSFPLLSEPRGGLEVVQGFVEAARRRAGSAQPRIAVVTASAQDPFEAVDFYLDLFAQLGVQAQWWPIDSALEQAVSTGRCEELEALRRQHLQLASRDRVYPDLASQQHEACLSPADLAALPSRMHGMFFSGGDQWRLRQALVDAQDRPNAWLLALRRAHADGTLVVGGTSAGAAVQSGAGMPSNGDTASALAPGPLVAHPPTPGCSRASRCVDGLDEARFTWWPDGGTGLAEAASVDTHFSERGRELRLLALMHAGGAKWGFGADETSALQVRGEGENRTVAAHGERGGWVFETVRSTGDGVLRARVHYLAPGASLLLRAGGPVIEGDLQEVLPDAVGQPATRDALARGAIRAAAWRLAHGESTVGLEAAGGTVELRRSADTRAWRHGESVGVSHLELHYFPGPSAASIKLDDGQDEAAP